MLTGIAPRNLLDYPATTFPASSRVDAKLDQPDTSFKAKSETDAEIQVKCEFRQQIKAAARG